MNWRPFQRRLFKALETCPLVVLSVGWANGKSTLACHLVHRCLTPGDALFREGHTSYLVAGSLGQARRSTFQLLKELIRGDPSYKVTESNQQCAVTHRATKTRAEVLPCSGKRSLGMVRVPLVVADEPGSWPLTEGKLMHDLIRGSLVKEGGVERAIFIGTLAPAPEDGWWHKLVKEGSGPGVFVEYFKGERKTWDQWPTIAKCNPVLWSQAKGRRGLLLERDKARRDPEKKANYLSYRLNLPTADQSSVVLTVAEWKALLRCQIAPRTGRPIIGVDLGAGRAWSTAVGIWPNGRTEAVAICPGIPSVEDQERRDRVQVGTYQRLVDQGSLLVAEGLHVPPPGLLVDLIRDWKPRVIICDRFRLGELRDTKPGCPILPRVSRWSESTADIQALRRFALDGPLSVAMGSRALLEASLAVARIKTDDAGNVRLHKGRNNTARDDVCAGWILAAGALSRIKPQRRAKFALVG